MKRISLLLMGLCLFWGLKANVMVQLQEQEASGIENADLYYNLGVGYWQTGESAKSCLYFLRALNLDSAHKQARENLDYLKAISLDKDLYPQNPFLIRIFLAFWDFMNINRMALATLVLLLITAISLSWLMHYDPQKERGLPSLIFGICLTIFTISAAFLGVKAYRMQHNAKAVIMSPELELKSSANMKASRVAVVHEALIVQVEEQSEGWSRVRTPDGNAGWLPSSEIMRVIEN
mgnify:CR=1 FL=1